MKKKIVLAVVVAAVVLAAAFALHRPQAGTQPTPEPTRQAETNDAVPAEPTPQPAATAEPQPTATTPNPNAMTLRQLRCRIMPAWKMFRPILKTATPPPSISTSWVAASPARLPEPW